MRSRAVFCESTIVTSTEICEGASKAAGAAPAGPTPAERAIEYRQAVYKVVAGNFGPLSQTAQGKADFKPESASKQAARLSQIATFVGDAYPDISKEGKTRALPAIWSNRKDFDQIVADFTTHTKTLAEVVELGISYTYH